MEDKLKRVIELADKIMHFIDMLEDDRRGGYVYYDKTVRDALDIIYDASLEIKNIVKDISKHPFEVIK